MNYPFPSLWLNGRFVRLESIIDETLLPKSEFEKHTFSFIREWLSGENTFTLHTSGSTGTPKEIKITRDQMMASAKASEEALGLKPRMNALVCIDTRYIGGKMMLVRSFVTGMRITAIDPCASPLQKIPTDHCVNFAAFVPYQVQSMLGSKHPHLMDNPDVVIIGGAPLDEKIVDQLQSCHCRCYATYGMTETISHVALRKLNGEGKSEFFESLPGIQLQTDTRGCLTIEAPYLKEKIITNDLADLIKPGQFKWLGRWDNIINTGGFKVVPEKIETALQQSFNDSNITNRFFISGIADEKFGERVVLVLETSSSTEELLKKILIKIAALSSPYERPREILLSPAFTVTENGKINRVKTLREARSIITL